MKSIVIKYHAQCSEITAAFGAKCNVPLSPTKRMTTSTTQVSANTTRHLSHRKNSYPRLYVHLLGKSLAIHVDIQIERDNMLKPCKKCTSITSSGAPHKNQHRSNKRITQKCHGVDSDTNDAHKNDTSAKVFRKSGDEEHGNKQTEH